MSDRGRKWALAAASIGVGLLLAELICRLVIPPPMDVKIRVNPPPKSPPAAVLVKWPAGRGGLYVDTPSGRRLRPNATLLIERHAVSGMSVEIRTNALGYRNREVGEKKGRRVLFIGDSITFADYLSEDESFVRQVETIARGHGLDWETINAGVGAVSLKTELAILLETGLALEPDVVVLGWYLNDFLDSPGVEVHPVGGLARHSRLVFALWSLGGPKPTRGRADDSVLPLSQWRDQWKQNDHPLLATNAARESFYRDVEESFFDWGGAWSPDAWEVMNPLLEELVRLSERHDFKLVWLAFPSRQQVEAGFDTSQPQQQLAHTARRLAVPLLDLLPVLRDLQRKGEGPLFYDQCHHTPRGSRLLAETIFAWLQRTIG
jgi:hypothetical protein